MFWPDHRRGAGFELLLRALEMVAFLDRFDLPVAVARIGFGYQMQRVDQSPLQKIDLPSSRSVRAVNPDGYLFARSVLLDVSVVVLMWADLSIGIPGRLFQAQLFLFKTA